MRLPVPIDPLAPVRTVRSWLGNAEGRRHRRSTVTGNRAHIEVRGVQDTERSAMVEDLRSALTAIDGVDWAEVDAIVGRAVVLFDPDAVELDDIVSVVEDVEETHEASDERFPHDRPDHPADTEPIQRHAVALGADALGFGVAAISQALRITRIPAEIPGIVALIDGQPRFRRFLENRIGPPATDLTITTTAALAQALSAGPVGLVVDMAHRSSLIAEQAARRSAWQRREPELVEGPHSIRHDAIAIPERPAPVPKGPIERYTEVAAISSLGVVGATLGATRDPRRAADLVFTGVPKAATLGREAFAAHLDAALSRHGVLVMDPAVLRRFDRVDTLVLDARLIRTGRWSVDRVEPVGDGADETSVTARTRSMLDPMDPFVRRTQQAWTLELWEGDVRAPRGMATRGRRLGKGGRRVMGLWRGDQLSGLVALAEDPAPLSADLVAAARSEGLDVVLSGGNDAMAERLGDIARWTATHIVEEIRTHQSAGHVVMFVSGRAHKALRTADVGVGVESPGRRAPLGAHIVIDQGLGQGWLILDGLHRARSVSRRSALIALGGATSGGTWALLGSSRFAAQRVMLAVNTSALLSMTNGVVAGARVGALSPPPSPSPYMWHELGSREVLRLVGSGPDGLEMGERSIRTDAEIARPDRSPVGLGQAVLDELANPLTPLLGLGAALSAAVGSVTDSALVLGVVGVNSLVGAGQRMQTERALVELESTGETTNRVLVEGAVVEIPSISVVVGDVVQLEAGDTLPGDGRLLSAVGLEVDESTLTGESLPVAKTTDPTPGAPVAERSSMLYEGTVIAAGEALAVIVAVGIDTEAGRSAVAAGSPPPSGVEQRLSRLTDLTVPITLGAGALATGLSFLYRRPTREAVGTGVSLMVAAVPEGLPALATLAQVASARRLAGRNALVRNPRAIEALGRVDRVCFDKTGTLTEGRVSLVSVCNDGVEQQPGFLDAEHREILAAARKATPRTNGDQALPHATDRAVLEAAVGCDLDDDHIGWMRIDDLPFGSHRSFHAVLGRHGRRREVAVKGAPEAVLPLCDQWHRGGESRPIGAEALRLLEDEVETLARRGLRVLAVATAKPPPRAVLNEPADVPPLTLLGFVCLADSIRPAAAAAVTTLSDAGIQVAMVTGDHPSTAAAIAADLGMLNGGRVLTGSDLDALDDDQLDTVIDDVAVFARTTPLQKVRIVAAYQRLGHTVAMTGDGANDAAAIRLADAGIALGGRGTDAARSHADVVVVDDRVETIVDAVVEGRAMWESVRHAVAILVGGNLGELGFTLVGTALGGSAPLNPRQLLLVNLLTDMAPALAIALREPPDRSPEALLHAGPDESLGPSLNRDIAIRAGATAAGATGAWAVGRMTGTPTRARTIGLAALVGTQLGQTLVAGGTSPIVLGATVVSTGVLVVAIQTPGVSQFFGCRPLGPVGWSTAAAASLLATGGSVVVPRTVESVGAAIAARRVQPPIEIPEVPSPT